MFFFRGSAFQVFRQCDGAKCGLGFAKTIFWGKGFGKTSAEFSRPQKGVWGMNAGGLDFGFFGGNKISAFQFLSYFILKFKKFFGMFERVRSWSSKRNAEDIFNFHRTLA